MKLTRNISSKIWAHGSASILLIVFPTFCVALHVQSAQNSFFATSHKQFTQTISNQYKFPGTLLNFFHLKMH